MGQFDTLEVSQVAPQPQVPTYGIDTSNPPLITPSDWERYKQYFPPTPGLSPSPEPQKDTGPRPYPSPQGPSPEVPPTRGPAQGPMPEEDLPRLTLAQIKVFNLVNRDNMPMTVEKLQGIAGHADTMETRKVAQFMIKNFDSLSGLSPKGNESEITKADLDIYADLLEADEDFQPKYDARRHVAKNFDVIDRNRDGNLSLAEMNLFHSRNSEVEKAGDYFRENFREISREQEGSVHDALISRIDLESMVDDAKRIKKLKETFVDEEVGRQTTWYQIGGGGVGLLGAGAVLFYLVKNGKEPNPRAAGSMLISAMGAGSQIGKWIGGRFKEGGVKNYYEQRAKTSIENLFTSS
jgi:hypothetical protein